MPLAVCASAAFSVLFIARASFFIDGQRYFTLFDDAMVSMRYGRTLAEGGGLVWNAGEPPVEGYTNFLWTLWMAAVHLLRLPDRLTSLIISISGAVIVAATAVVAARLVRRLQPEDRGSGATVAAFAVGLCYPLLYWSLRGMEVGLLALLVALAVEEALRAASGEQRPVRFAILLALLTLVRPDGIIPALLIAASAASAVGVGPGSDRGRTRVRPPFAVCAVPIVLLAAHTVFRQLYYGSALPNTYYLKMTGVAGPVRWLRGVEVLRNSLWYLAVPFVVAAADRRVYRNAATALFITVPLTLAAYTLYVGGDAWEWMPYTDRYLTPALPLLFAAAAATISRAERDGFSHAARGAMNALAALVLIAVVSGPGFADWFRTRGAHVVDDANKVWMGVRIRQMTGPTTRIAVVWAGAVPYFARRPAIDFLGKSDPVIAHHAPVAEFLPGHDRFDYDYSIGMLRPDLVVQLWFPTDQLFQQLPRWGYEQVYGGVFAKRGAEVDVARLKAAFDEPAIQ